MKQKVVSDKDKPVDRACSVRLSPIALIQMDKLQDFMGENASRVMVRALDMLYNRYADQIQKIQKKVVKKVKSRR